MYPEGHYSRNIDNDTLVSLADAIAGLCRSQQSMSTQTPERKANSE
ncbi:MAG: hypothetical protein R2941_07710 [Desulfobacterales bacterium]